MTAVALTKKDLIDFENDIAACFNQKLIRAPIHLYSQNEEAMIDIFKEVRPQDWVICSWRSHYQCLLKGVPAKELKEEIIKGRSICLSFPKQRIFSSAIVGGSLPIATGIALGIKRRNEDATVHCFLGEMTAETGIAHECIKYATNFDLPIRFIVEDNEKSVCTDTRDAWNQPVLSFEKTSHPKVVYYKYELTYPHAGSGVRIQF